MSDNVEKLKWAVGWVKRHPVIIVITLCFSIFSLVGDLHGVYAFVVDNLDALLRFSSSIYFPWVHFFVILIITVGMIFWASKRDALLRERQVERNEKNIKVFAEKILEKQEVQNRILGYWMLASRQHKLTQIRNGIKTHQRRWTELQQSIAVGDVSDLEPNLEKLEEIERFVRSALTSIEYTHEESNSFLKVSAGAVRSQDLIPDLELRDQEEYRLKEAAALLEKLHDVIVMEEIDCNEHLREAQGSVGQGIRSLHAQKRNAKLKR